MRWVPKSAELPASAVQTYYKMKGLEANTVPSLLLEHHIRKVIKEVNYKLVTVKTAFNYMEKEIHKTSIVWSSHLMRHTVYIC